MKRQGGKHMNKVINNKRYNTDTAIMVGQNGTTILYKKKTGEFFIADQIADAITPLSYDKALAWTQQNGIKGVDQHFNFKAGKTVTSFSLPKMSVEQLKRIATARGESSSEVLADLIAEAYDKL